MVENRKKLAKNLVWSIVERLTSQVLYAVISIVLARLLLPEQFSTVALVSVFVNLVGVVVQSGFCSALIYDDAADQEHYSTAFFSTLVITLALYLMMFLAAPYIARFYNDSSLVSILRVMSFQFVFQGVYSILFAYMSKHMLFRKNYFATLVGSSTAATVAIVLALRGYGVWSLVCLSMVEAFTSSVVLWKLLHFKLTFTFRFDIAKSMFKYCWKLVGVDLLNSLYSSLNSLIIAKRYKKAELAYYTKSYNIPQMLLGSVNTAISKVLFPAFSETKDDFNAIKSMLRRGIQVTNYMLMPLLVGLAAVAKGFTVLVFTEKWTGMIPYLQIMCMVWVFQPVQIYVVQAFKAIGKSDMYLKLEMLKKIVAICILLFFLAVVQKPIAIAWALLLGQIASAVINMPSLRRLFAYSYREQIKDLCSSMVMCAVMAAGTILAGTLFGNMLLRTIVQVAVGAAIYVLLSFVTKNTSFIFAIQTIKRAIASKRKAN